MRYLVDTTDFQVEAPDFQSGGAGLSVRRKKALALEKGFSPGQSRGPALKRIACRTSFLQGLKALLPRLKVGGFHQEHQQSSCLRFMKEITNAGGTVCLALLLALPACAQQQGGMQPSSDGGVVSTQRPQILQQVGIDQHLNQLDLHFHDEAGKDVRLGDFFGKRPVILSLVYYRCPMLCGEVLNGMTSALSVVSFDLGKDYDVVTVSIDPRETPAVASGIKNVYMRRYNRDSPSTRQGWHFLTGAQDQIKQLAAAVGFRYVYDPRIDQYAHASGIEVVTPDGRISQYYYGIEYSPKDLRLGLIQASKNHIGTVVDSFILYCYHYDPATGHYGAAIMRVLRLAGVATVLLLGGFVFIMVRRDVRAGRLDTGRTA
jgi:protein SCO1